MEDLKVRHGPMERRRTSCDLWAMTVHIRTGYRALVLDAEQQIVSLTPEEAAERRAAGAVIIDIRDIRELERVGRIPGSKHMPRGMLEFWVDPDSPYFKTIFLEDVEFVLHCASGWRSALATKTLQDMGLEQVSHIAGGFQAWQKAGLPVELAERRKPG